jgi:hypothetical protein
MWGPVHEVVLYSLMVDHRRWVRRSRIVPDLLTLILSVTQNRVRRDYRTQQQIQNLFDAKPQDGSWIFRLLASKPIAAECH